MIPITLHHSITREEYYKIFVPKGDPKDLYDLICKRIADNEKKLQS
jgi:hypothetical protein